MSNVAKLEPAQAVVGNLNAALVKARIATQPTVHKSGRNQAQGYSYVGHEQVLTSGAREALLAQGLILEQRKVEYLGPLEYSTKSGPQLCWRWRGTFALVHSSGEERAYEFEATTGTNDKSSYVASTALDRTAVMRVLQLAGSSEENPEHDSHDRMLHAAAKSAKMEKTIHDIAASAEPDKAVSSAKLEEIVSNYNMAVKTAVESSGLKVTGECDARGMMLPPGDVPMFGSGPDAGKPYNKVPAGKLRALMANEKWQEVASAATKIHTAYIVAVHEAEKLSR
jgi:hypothetical protein